MAFLLIARLLSVNLVFEVGLVSNMAHLLFFILRATPSAAGPFWLLGVAILGAWCLHFDILGDRFGTSSTPWGAILARWAHPGGPWGQQDGDEVVRKRLFIDFEVRGLVYISFLISRSLKCYVWSGLSPILFFYDF